MTQLVHFNVCLDQADIDLARQKGIKLSTEIRNVLHNLLNSERGAGEQLAVLREKLNDMRQNQSDLAVSVRQTETLIKEILDGQEKASKLEEERIATLQKQKQHCPVCDTELEARDHEVIRSGPHIGRVVCNACVWKILGNPATKSWMYSENEKKVI